MSSVRREQLVAADGTRLALYRLGSPDGPTVILVPGTFSNHTFWLGTRGHGMAWSLADAGFDVMVLDLRGHGGSERRDQRWTFEDWGRLDVVAPVPGEAPGARSRGRAAGRDGPVDDVEPPGRMGGR